MCVYSGAFIVEDDVFRLSAVRLIVREDELAFQLTGRDDGYGDFTTDGIAERTEQGFFMASENELRYVSYPLEEGDKVSIKFDVVEPSKDSRICRIEALWVENGEASISANLELVTDF
ncbi:MAG: hypothetical protein V3U84_07625 [Thiotrichaceae bacterium]